MIKDVVVGEKRYTIDTTPQSRIGTVKFAKVSAYSEHETSGVIAGAFEAAFGKKLITRHEDSISREEKFEVVMVLGRKFSASRAWQNLCQLAEIHMRQRKERL